MTAEKTSPKNDTFPEVREVIRLRTAQVHGSYANLARECSISRQCLNQRITSATKWPNSHKWFVFVLFLHDPLDRMTSQEALQASVPSKEKVKTGLIGQEEVWQQCWKTRGQWDQWRKA
jgi:hypothetical protein